MTTSLATQSLPERPHCHEAPHVLSRSSAPAQSAKYAPSHPCDQGGRPQQLLLPRDSARPLPHSSLCTIGLGEPFSTGRSAKRGGDHFTSASRSPRGESSHFLTNIRRRYFLRCRPGSPVFGRDDWRMPIQSARPV
jgi:hypothetical protein